MINVVAKWQPRWSEYPWWLPLLSNRWSRRQRGEWTLRLLGWRWGGEGCSKGHCNGPRCAVVHLKHFRQSSERPEHHVRPFHPCVRAHRHTLFLRNTERADLFTLINIPSEVERGTQRDTFLHLLALFLLKKNLISSCILTHYLRQFTLFISLFLQLVPSNKEGKKKNPARRTIPQFLTSSRLSNWFVFQPLCLHFHFMRLCMYTHLGVHV